jgi:adenylylsulfate kinase-like enzyme
MTREEKLEVFREAVRLAGTGKYTGWKKIQSRLVKSGHKRAPELLDGKKIRMILDTQCKLANSRS